jgi:hypothetical protein
MDGKESVTITGDKGIYNWWAGQFYVSENIGSDSGYEYVGEKIAILIVILDMKRLVLVNKKEFLISLLRM